MRRTAKILFFSILILLLLGGFFSFRKDALASAEVIINEVMYNPSGTDSGNEWIELYNTSGTEISLNGWDLKPDGGSYYNLNGKTIAAKDFLVLTGFGNMRNTKGHISLYNSTTHNSSTIIDYLQYGTEDSANTENIRATQANIWNPNSYIPLFTEGISAERIIDGQDSNVPADWQESYIIGGTPGKENSKKSEDELEEKILCTGNPANIKINEIYPNTEDEADEFVEIINNSTDCVDISDWIIKDSTDTSSHQTIFLENTILEAGEYFYIKKKLYLNNDADTVYLLDKTGLEKDWREYKNAVRGKTYSFDGTDWLWTSQITPGLENKFDLVEDISDEDATTDHPAEDATQDYNAYLNEILPNPKGDERLGEFIEIYNAADSEIDLAGWTLKDASKTKYIFPAGTQIAAKEYLAIYRPAFKFAMNNSGKETIYLLDKASKIASSVSYTNAREDVSYNFADTAWQWSNFLTPGAENELEKKLKVAIVKIKANPKGKDTEGEEIYLKNKSKEKVNLKAWSIATGLKNLVNHPINEDFVIKPGKTKKITRAYSLFTLNNKKGAIELRYPNGEVASRVKYDKKKDSVKDDEVYEMVGKKWQWNTPPEESIETEKPATPEEASENIEPETETEISEEEIALNLGKYSAENKLALAEIELLPNNKNLLQSRETPGIVLGAFSARNENHKPIEIKSVNYWQKALQKSNQFFNFLIHRIRAFI